MPSVSGGNSNNDGYVYTITTTSDSTSKLTNNPMFNTTATYMTSGHLNDVMLAGSMTGCSSPTNSLGSMSSVNSNRSHDGVFLRPGTTVSRYVFGFE